MWSILQEPWLSVVVTHVLQVFLGTVCFMYFIKNEYIVLATSAGEHSAFERQTFCPLTPWWSWTGILLLYCSSAATSLNTVLTSWIGHTFSFIQYLIYLFAADWPLRSYLTIKMNSLTSEGLFSTKAIRFFFGGGGSESCKFVTFVIWLFQNILIYRNLIFL